MPTHSSAHTPDPNAATGFKSPRSAPTHRTIDKAISFTGTGLFTARPCSLRILPATAQNAHLGVRFHLLANPGQQPHAQPARIAQAGSPYDAKKAADGTGAKRTDECQGAGGAGGEGEAGGGGGGGGLFPAHVDHVVPAPRHTVLRRDPASPPSPSNPEVHTTEHLLAALFAMGVTAATLEVTGPEIPHMDGSAAAFARAILDAGISPLPAPLQPIVVSEPIRVDEADASLTAEPLLPPSTAASSHAPDHAEYAEYAYFLDYSAFLPHPAPPGLQATTVTHRCAAPATQTDAAHFALTLAPARTFCTQAEAMQLRAMGLFTHISPADAVVFGPDGPIDNALRFPDEAARHKLLDLLGDLALAGACRPIAARITARKTGHAANHALARKLAAMRA